eukprot:TRINITY_DN1021_c0_g1_i3.p1 TRINITY_DN1021_c0_g1~~TRINITY_DN1021_c0_g1_i3.p1  ORF type:complete len:259 (-),score=56.23 TRINITY_DN1021_c0_g1_i3:45-821(-)
MLEAIAPKKKGQRYVLANIEPNVIEYQLLTGESPKEHELDAMVYLTRHSDIQVNYFGTYSNYTVHSFFDPPPDKKPKPEWNITSPVLYLSSKCNKRRDDRVRELMQYMPVDSYGACLHNKDFPEDLKGREGVGSHGWSVKEELLRRYKFVLAYENNEYEDYVSEKFYQPLVHGCVPVYLGAPNIDDYILFPNSVVRANGFKSTEELARYLKFMDQNDHLYSEFFAWKRYGITEQLLNATHQALFTAPCRLCKYLSQFI